jgi:ornithine cyclodeaminase
LIGVKIATVFPDNPSRGLPSIHGEFMLISGETGQSIALIDGRALTLLRTAAVSALAADLLAPRSVEALLMVGTGALIKYLIEGHVAIRCYKDIGIWGRNAQNSTLLADRLAKQGLPVHAVSNLESAAHNADVISCATMAESALIQGRWLKPSAHLDLVGGFRPSMREADDACFEKSLVAVDTLDALNEAGDLIGPLENSTVDPDKILTLERLIREGRPPLENKKTVFKSVGCALADLASAEWLFRRIALSDDGDDAAWSVGGKMEVQ